MLVTRLRLKNWRNFREVDVALREQTYLIGANATGKSNLLDVFRFLRDVSKIQGGGLQKAIAERGGIPKLRCLHARKDTEVRIEVELSKDPDDTAPSWRYLVGFKTEGKGAQRALISVEEVWRNGTQILARPDDLDESDVARRTQTHLEQIQANSEFREIAEFFGEIRYLHLVPQLLKYGDRIGGNQLEDDPFGQGFLERVAKTTPKTRDARLRRIAEALELAVPQFQKLRFERDEITGRPHIAALYEHHRPKAGWQREEQFSDGTLRLLGLLWSLLERDSLLLLEEPELSLNDAIVEQIPAMLKGLTSDKKRRRQVLISTHSEALLENKGIDARGILLLEPGKEGTRIRSANEMERDAVLRGFSAAEVFMPKTRPEKAGQLGLFE